MGDPSEDAKKDTAVAVAGAAALVATASGPAGWLALAVGTLGTMLFNQWSGRTDRRVQKLLRDLVEGDRSPQEMEKRIKAALEDGAMRGPVFEAVIAGARAAADAIDEETLPYVVALSRAQANEALPLWLFRRALVAVTDLERQQVESLVRILAEVARQEAEEVIIEAYDVSSPQRGPVDVGIMVRRREGRDLSWSGGQAFCQVVDVARLFDAVRRSGLGEAATSSRNSHHAVRVEIDAARLVVGALSG